VVLKRRQTSIATCQGIFNHFKKK